MKLISRKHHIKSKLESQAIQAKLDEIKSLKSRKLRIERKMHKLNTRFARRGPADPALNRYWAEFLCPEFKITEAMIAAAEIELRFLIEKEESK